jgi:hypothetical protein
MYEFGSGSRLFSESGSRSPYLVPGYLDWKFEKIKSATKN